MIDCEGMELQIIAALAGAPRRLLSESNSRVVQHDELHGASTLARRSFDPLGEGAAAFHVHAATVPGRRRIGLPPYSYHSEGLHGLRNSFDTVGLNATLFPQTTAWLSLETCRLFRRSGHADGGQALNNYAEQRSLARLGVGLASSTGRRR